VRAYGRDLIRGWHYGQRRYVPRKQVGHMAAPTSVDRPMQAPREIAMHPRIGARTSCDRPAGPFDSLIVLVQREMASRFAVIPITQIWIVRAEANRLVKIFQALFELPDAGVRLRRAASASGSSIA
jgi:hypothetical protein